MTERESHNSNPIPEEVKRELDELFEQMQIPENQAAYDWMFSATPEEIQAVLRQRLITGETTEQA